MDALNFYSTVSPPARPNMLHIDENFTNRENRLNQIETTFRQRISSPKEPSSILTPQHMTLPSSLYENRNSNSINTLAYPQSHSVTL